MTINFAKQSFLPLNSGVSHGQGLVPSTTLDTSDIDVPSLAMVQQALTDFQFTKPYTRCEGYKNRSGCVSTLKERREGICM